MELGYEIICRCGGRFEDDEALTLLDTDTGEEWFGAMGIDAFGRVPGVVVYTYCGENNRIIIRLDGEVIDWFRKQVAQQGGGNYQTMINLAFREYLFTQREPLEEILRRVILEQLEHYL